MERFDRVIFAQISPILRNPWIWFATISAWIAVDPLKEYVLGRASAGNALNMVANNAAGFLNNPIFRVAMIPLFVFCLYQAARSIGAQQKACVKAETAERKAHLADALTLTHQIAAIQLMQARRLAVVLVMKEAEGHFIGYQRQVDDFRSKPVSWSDNGPDHSLRFSLSQLIGSLAKAATLGLAVPDFAELNSPAPIFPSKDVVDAMLQAGPQMGRPFRPDDNAIFFAAHDENMARIHGVMHQLSVIAEADVGQIEKLNREILTESERLTGERAVRL
jgi:hypothetical protein